MPRKKKTLWAGWTDGSSLNDFSALESLPDKEPSPMPESSPTLCPTNLEVQHFVNKYYCIMQKLQMQPNFELMQMGMMQMGGPRKNAKKQKNKKRKEKPTSNLTGGAKKRPCVKK